ncbi:MAG: hypothetical protein H8E12_09010 [Rhodobacteraceae bacterium]|nr:hypothetical protein [Paracoccaceae bacterium]
MAECEQLDCNRLIEAGIGAQLSQAEFLSVKQFVVGEKDPFCFYGTPEFEKLFDYFTREICEMPYDIAKARTGCPDEWILDYFSL